MSEIVTHRPKNFEELRRILKSIDKSGTAPYFAVFRGQNYDWDLKSGIARSSSSNSSDILEREQGLFFEFLNDKCLASKLQVHKLKQYAFSQIWLGLFQAQHLRLRTRLLDFSMKYESSLFFSIYDKKKEFVNENGVIWIYKCPRTKFFNFDAKLYNLNLNPFELEDLYLIKHYTQFEDDYFEALGEIRRNRQHGCFVITPSCYLDTAINKIDSYNQYFEKVLITPNIKSEIEEFLDPGLEDYLFCKIGVYDKIKAKLIETKVDYLNKKYF